MIGRKSILTAKRLAAAIIAACAVFEIGVAVASESRDGAIRIPEVYVPNGDDYCVVRADLSGGDADTREANILNFIRVSYQTTNHWHQNYIISAVDYATFTYVHVVFRSSCIASGSAFPEVAQNLSGCATSDHDCPLTVAFALEPHSPLVSRSPANALPITLFGRFRSPQELQQCTIAVPASIPTRVEELQSLHNHLDLLRLKYRMSILDIYLLDDRFYLLFERQCDIKSDLYAEAMGLLKAEGFAVGNYLGTPDFTPDLGDYIFVETGKR